jgi:hypothetical protein
MKSKLLGLILCAALVLTGGVALCGPELTIPDSTFDFGFVPQHAKISHYFWLHSTGDSLLKITKVLPG